MSRVPLIDIGPFLNGSLSDKRRVARAVDTACREIGFLVITGHGVSPALRADVTEAMAAFFALPDRAKMKWAFTADNPRGYRRLTATTLSKSRGEDSPPDLMERFSIGQFDIADDEYHRARRHTVFQDNRWPELVPAVERAAKPYYREMERVAGDLMKIFAAALDLPEAYFEPFFDRHISMLVTNFYPPQLQAPEPGQLRAGAHTDYGSLTILAAAQSPGGLQVRGDDGAWHEVPHLEGAYIVNIGDCMARWTNDRWVSTMHRVVNPDGSAARDPRMSIVFFQQPNDDAIVSCIPTCTDARNLPKYAPITSGAYMAAKIGRTFAAAATGVP
jgi:isopenicillin N synthase-like dioxygenase